MGRSGWRALPSAALLGMLAFAGPANASETWMAEFQTTYPAAVGTRIDSCLLCHQTASGSPSSPRNAYGVAYDAAGHSFTAINAADSDLDGFTNLVEITQFFFPGNAADHPLPAVTIAATDASASEAGPTTGVFTLTRNGSTAAALTVNYTVTGTATAGSDYTALAGSVQIPAGALTATVTVTPIDDLLVEPGETVVAALSANAAYTLGTPASATVTIQSDDGALPTVTIAATDPTASEAGPTTGQFTLTRTGVTTAALTVNYAVTGTATAGGDYTALAGSVQIPAGALTATVTVTPIDDLLVEPDETVVATLSANAAYTVGTPASATVTIQSDDGALPTVTIAATDSTASEAGPTTGQFTLTRTGVTTAALTVNYTVTGTATAGSDYIALAGSVQIPAGALTATVTVTPIDDQLVEPDETVVATLNANAAYTLGTPVSATVSIQSDDPSALPTVTIAATDPTASEAGPTTGQFMLTRTGVTTAALTVNYAVTGTATAGSDYTALGGSVQIPAGALTATVTVTPIDDLLVEPDETVVATLSADAAYTVGTPASATVTIQSDDPSALPTVTIVATNPTTTEGGALAGAFAVMRTGSTAAGLTVNYLVMSTANPGSDYVPLGASVTIPPGSTSVTIAVTPLNGSVCEFNETVVLTLSTSSAYNVGGPGTATVTILEDGDCLQGHPTSRNDFDGDNRTDIGIYDPAGGHWYAFSSAEGFWEAQFGYRGTIPVTGDFDGDGRSDIGVYDPPAGMWHLFASTAGFSQTQFGFAGTIPVVGDFDGDGRSDIGVYFAPTGTWSILRSAEGFLETQFGYDGTIPMAADFDGDGRCDLGVYFAPGGNWHFSKSTEGFSQTQFGFDGTIPVYGDFDGDFRDDFGVYDPQGGTWYLYLSIGGFVQTQFGFAGTEPVVGDFDGDGLDDIGVYDAQGGTWYIFKSTEGFVQTLFGFEGTIPLGGTLR